VNLLAGVDEAGRGPLAGPVIAAAVILDPAHPIPGLADSKQLTAVARERLAGQIRRWSLAWAVGAASVEEIDTLNILQATLLAMRRALHGLVARPRHILIDGNQAPALDGALAGCLIETLVKGDALVPAISAASIIAKTHRDQLMCSLDAKFPGYGLARHFGYPTALHIKALAELGPSPIHRRSFAPVRAALR
jgi:ribonuclease HII